MAKKRLLVVDNHQGQRETYRQILEDAGYDVTTARSGEEGLQLAREGDFDLVLADDKSSTDEGLMLLIDFARQEPSAFVLMITPGREKTVTPGSVESIKSALRGVEFDFLEKPVGLSQLLGMVESACARAENKRRRNRK